MAHQVYMNAAGEEVPSVTTVLSLLNKPALVTWAYNLGRAGKDLRSTRDDAADGGTYTHQIVRADLLGLPQPPAPPELSLAGMERAAICSAAYLQWRQGRQFAVLHTETPLVSERHRYGGTPDAILRADGGAALYDWKTAKWIYPEFLYQLAGYGGLIEERLGLRVVEYHLLRLDPEPGKSKRLPFEHATWTDLGAEWESFLHLLEVYRRKAGTEAKAKRR